MYLGGNRSRRVLLNNVNSIQLNLNHDLGNL